MNQKVTRRRRPAFVQILFYAVILCLLWIMLWDDVSGMTVLSGLLIGLIIPQVFYLPAIELSGRFHLGYAIVFVVWFCWSVLVASFQVAWLTVRPKRVDAGSVVSVELTTRSDLIITLVALVNGLIPGSMVIELDRARAVLFIHALNCSDDARIETARASTLKIERLLVAAIGSRADVLALNATLAARGEKPLPVSGGRSEMRR